MATLTAAVLLPLLTVACGDEENGTALARRGAERDVNVDVQYVHDASRVPSADIYLLGGGGEDAARLVAGLRASTVFEQHVREGGVVLAVDAGMDALGTSVADASGRMTSQGLGLLDIRSETGPAADGFVVTGARPDLALPSLVGWVFHQRRTVLGADAQPFLSIECGPGTGGSDGVVSGHVIGTRLHGPLLARNPEVADLLLTWALGVDPSRWEPLQPSAAEAARAQRVTEEVERTRRGRRPRSIRTWGAGG